MTNPELTLIAALLDRSRSMYSIAEDMCGGFDALIATERSHPGTTEVTLAQFDGEYQVVYTNRPIADVPPLVLQPRRGTALLDAVGRFVTDLDADLAARPEDSRPGRVTVLVITDGEENSSVEWSHPAVRQLVEERQEDGWDFAFLGANMDAIDVGTGLGFAPDRSLTWTTTASGVAGAFASLADYTTALRSAPAGSRADVGFDDTDRRRARGSS